MQGNQVDQKKSAEAGLEKRGSDSMLFLARGSINQSKQLDYLVELSKLKKRAEEGQQNAQFTLALAYRFGWRGLKIDKEQSNHWLEKVSNDTESDFHYCIKGLNHEEKNDMKKAIEFYNTAAGLNFVPGMFARAVLYLKEANMSKKNAKQLLETAISFLEKCVKAKYPPAKTRLGECYLNGYGVPKNRKEGFRLIEEAAGWGDASAKRLLGYCCENGLGIPKDTSMAQVWYRSAGKQGYDVLADLARVSRRSCCTAS